MGLIFWRDLEYGEDQEQLNEANQDVGDEQEKDEPTMQEIEDELKKLNNNKSTEEVCRRKT